MKKTANFDAFAQFADAQLSNEEMKNIKGGRPAMIEGGDGGNGGGGTGGGTTVAERTCYSINTGKWVKTLQSTTGREYLENGTDITHDATDKGHSSGLGYINCH